MKTLPQWPYLTAEVPPLVGRIKVRPEDFVVEEIPQYPCSGEGTHTYFQVEKRGLTTLELVRRLARALGRREVDIGYAGLKDARAVTRQMMSIEHLEPERLAQISLQDVQILRVDRHVNKLKLGHLAGNRFSIKVREIDTSAEQAAREGLETLVRRGVPNYFGHQRFGVRGDSWLMGRAVIQGNPKDLVDQFCGRPDENDREMIRRARELYDRGQYELAAEVWPGYFRDARRACRILAGNPTAFGRAFASIDRNLKRLFVSAYQSYLFNEVLARRIEAIDRMETGDLAYKHENGAVFMVENADVEQPRAAQFEISPSGPLYGYRMRFPEGEPGRVEAAVLEAEGLSTDEFRQAKGHKIKGSRRPLRVRVSELATACGEDEHGPYLQLDFVLPAGSYATAVLRELMKEHLLRQELGGDGED
ncbi:MAG: tRNA pseudouridine(13) synthase TruD [Phycisphaerae bacterium]|nr:tRNA pseudouridine(13) synthase TruD [Phycisphaerae bacterium]